jgi:hypothetical protein
MRTSEAYTVITGASMGLGKEFATECARRGRNLVLVALPGQQLAALCGELELKYGIHAVARECDLTDEAVLNRLVENLLDRYSIDQLINNAGIGGTVRFEDSTPEYLDRIIHLNIRATTILTRLLLPELSRHKKSLILNVASVAAFGPLPFKTIYPASKAFIYSFSRSLRNELRRSGVRVVVLTPGPIMTNPDVARRILKQGFLGRLGLLTAYRISQLALNGAARGKEVIVPGLMNRFNRFLIRWIPESWRLALMARIIRKEISAQSGIV